MKKVSLTELPSIALAVLGRVPTNHTGAAIIALQGELGAGKTTFVQALARELGITDTIQSPTYVLMKAYPIVWGDFRTFVHIDAYRLEHPEEFKTLSPETFLTDPHALVCIEWPEKVAGFLPQPQVVVRFSHEAALEGERYIGIDNG